MVYSPIVYLVSLFSVALTVNGAELTTATAIGPAASNPLADNPTPTIILTVAPTAVSPCQQLEISWTVAGISELGGTELTLSYTNGGVNQTGNGLVYNPRPQSGDIAIQPLDQSFFLWNVFLADSGYYVVSASTASRSVFVIQRSERFLVTGDSSCLSASTTSPIATGTGAPPPNASSQPASSDTGASSASSPKIGSIIGGTIAAVVIVGLIVAFLLFRRRRNVIAKNVNQRVASGGTKGHRKWGGLASIDKLEGEIPVVMPSNSPYGNQAYNRTRSQSTGRAMTEEEGLEKGYGKDRFPVDADILSEMPTLNSNRESRRYSSDAVSAVLRQNSGLAAFNDEHSRKRTTPAPAAPVLSTTTATAGGGDDPFSDAAFISRGNRASALSVPSTARAPSRVSEISAHDAPSPLPPTTTTPVQSQPSSQANTMNRNTSATASIGRPSRKPVPQYTDDSIELSHSTTSRSSPTSQGFPSRSGSGPAPSSSMADLSSSMTSYDALASSADSNTHWLRDHRAPVANRQIGLAGQGDGPVHYLMPDLPPPLR